MTEKKPSYLSASEKMTKAVKRLVPDSVNAEAVSRIATLDLLMKYHNGKAPLDTLLNMALNSEKPRSKNKKTAYEKLRQPEYRSDMMKKYGEIKTELETIAGV